jgi:lysophospholipase L1-like esterase
VRLGLAFLLVGLAGVVLSGAVELPDPLKYGSRLALLLGVGQAGIAWLASRLLGRRRTDTLLVNLSLAGAAILVGLVGCELAVRAIYRDVTTTSDNASFFARRFNAEHVRLNANGFRERDVSTSRPPGTYRIAVVGDSFTYGQGIRVEERFTELLEERLNQERRNGTRYEVLNFGAPGTETVHHVRTLKEDVLPHHPNFVLMQWYGNDVNSDASPLKPRYRRLIPSDYLQSVLRDHSALYYLARRAWERVQSATVVLAAEDDFQAAFADPGSDASRTARAHLTEFISSCQQAGVPVGIVLFPHLAGENIYAFLHPRVLERPRRFWSGSVRPGAWPVAMVI